VKVHRWLAIWYSKEKARLTGAISSVVVKEIQELPITEQDRALQVEQLAWM